MRVAIVTETFLPTFNGVVGSVLRIAAHLADRGDSVLILAPAAPGRDSFDLRDHPEASDPRIRLVPLPSAALPMYPDVRLAAGGSARVRRVLAEFGPDVVHLASPFVLGARAIRACQDLGLPTVAVYQTDVPAYAAGYGMPGLEPVLWARVRYCHQRASPTLAPSDFAAAQLREMGIVRVRRWGRGVDTALFRPRCAYAAPESGPDAEAVPGGAPPSGPSREAEAVPADWRPRPVPAAGPDAGDVRRVVGYVGRLAAEKQVEDLRVFSGRDDVRLVIVGEGPWRRRLQAILPDAEFTGFLSGERLARAVAAFDVCVAPGESETFGQTIQEAMACGVPVVAPARGGPLDLVDHSHTGWLYEPGDLRALRSRVLDLAGDDAKRAAFGRAAYESVRDRTWRSVCSQLVGHYAAVIDDPTPQVLTLRARGSRGTEGMRYPKIARAAGSGPAANGTRAAGDFRTGF